MWQLVLANISLKGWVIDSNQHSLSDYSSHALVIPAHNAEIIWGHFMTTGLKMVIDGWWWPQVFPESFSKCSAWLPYVFILTVHPTTLVPVYHPTFLQYVIFVFWVDKELPDGIGPFEVHFNVMSSADVLAGFTQSLHIGHHYVWLVVIGGTVCLFFLFWFLFICSLFKAHAGYLQLLRALLMWSSSSFSSWWLEQTVLALCLKVLMTLYLADRWWWMSHCRYKSICVGFL